MPSHLWRLCVCHLLTWFSIIAEAVFYTDFMGQVIFQGDPTVQNLRTLSYTDVLERRTARSVLTSRYPNFLKYG